jgi:hypothetical protein
MHSPQGAHTSRPPTETRATEGQIADRLQSYIHNLCTPQVLQKSSYEEAILDMYTHKRYRRAQNGSVEHTRFTCTITTATTTEHRTPSMQRWCAERTERSAATFGHVPSVISGVTCAIGDLHGEVSSHGAMRLRILSFRSTCVRRSRNTPRPLRRISAHGT